MKKDDFSNKFNELKSLVNSKEPSVPTQLVTPLKSKVGRKRLLNEEDEPFTFWTTSERMKKIKMKALLDDTSIKELINKAIDLYLNK
jgi:hypothetical protein